MATINQVQKGFAKFIDAHVAGAYSGIEKVIVSGAAALIASKLPDVLYLYSQKPMVAALGLYNRETGFVDVDAIYNAFVPQMGVEKLPIELPTFGKINLGTIKLGKDEINTLVKYIREA